MHYVYIIKSLKTGKLYIGYTNNLRRRLSEHNTGQSRATKSSTPHKLVYYEAYNARFDAIKREAQLKHYKQGYARLKERLKFSLAGQN